MQAKNQEIDYIVVGSGPGGATVAKELTQRKKKVLILEWGDNEPLSGSFWYGLKSLLWPGKCLLFTGQLLGLVRGITTGGSTVFYYATCFPVPFEMLESHGIDITREVDEMREVLPIGPLKDEMIGPMAGRIMGSAQDIGYNWQKLDKFMYQDKWRPEYPFGHFGVEYRKSGTKHTAFAPKTIVSAGGIGTPTILRASGIKGAGYDFFSDPLIGVRGTVKNIEIPASEIPMSAGVHMMDEGYMMTDMIFPPATTALFTAQVFRYGQMFSCRNTLQILVKAKDELGGRLTDSGGVRKNLDENDKKKLQKGYERAKEILKNGGAKNTYKTWYLAAHPGVQ